VQSDNNLWDEYDLARVNGDAKAMAHWRAAIVECHLGFLINYANRTAFKSWSQDRKVEYLHELVIIALSRVDSYNRQRGTKFITHIYRALQPARWKLEGNYSPISTGYETQRLYASIRRHQSEAFGRASVFTIEELSEKLSDAHGKSIGTERVRRIIESPYVISGDQQIPGKKDASPSDVMTVFESISSDVNIENDVASDFEKEDSIQRVREALRSLDLDFLDRQIVDCILSAAPRSVFKAPNEKPVVMSPGPSTDSQLAIKLGYPKKQVTEARERLEEKLRLVLA
jgi:hypothetical protein